MTGVAGCGGVSGISTNARAAGVDHCIDLWADTEENPVNVSDPVADRMPDDAIDATRKLAGHVASISISQLNANVVQAFRRALLDYLTCAIAGAGMQSSRIVLDYLQSWDQAREACVIGAGRRLSAQNAAFVNGTSAHGLDLDDGMTRGSVHPGGAVFPALLAMAEKLGSKAEDIIAAGVAAYDITLRMASTVHPHSTRCGFHNTPTSGVFGAAAAAARLLGLDAGLALNTLGLAGSFSGGLRAFLADGAEVKRIHPGKAARDGIVSAELAMRGLTGPAQVIEGRFGFVQAFARGNADWPRLTGDLGNRFEICSVYFKPYPACRHFHAALDAVRNIAECRPFKPEEVASVRIGLYEAGATGHDQKTYENLLDAQMSAPVTTALAIAFGNVTVPSFDRKNLEQPEVRRLIDVTEVYVDEECDRIYPGRRSGVAQVRFNDGSLIEERVLDPKGEGENPMSDDDLSNKFLSNCEPLIGAARCRELLETVWRFEAGADPSPLYRWSNQAASA
ncbi:MAG: MmgE/PrpD family protein [Betaproteobacteria bacterium]